MAVNRKLFLSLCIAAGLPAMSAAADGVADFYKATTVSIVVGQAAGGGYDTYARAMARHMPRLMPGQPTMIVQNRPGAGSLSAANYVYNVAPQDGSVIVTMSRGAPMLQIMGDDGPQFEATKFQWLGSMNSEDGALYVWHTSKVKTFKDAFSETAYLGSSGPNDSEFYPALANNILGTKFALIRGYKSGPDVRLAIERGEVEGQSQTWDSVKHASPELIKEGKIRVIAQIALRPREDMTALGAPMIMDFITRENVLPQFTVEEAKTYFKLMLAANQLGRPFAVGPGVPMERVDALRKAVAAVAADPAFIAENRKEGRDVDPTSGEEMQAMFAELATTPKQVLSNAKELVKFKGVVKQLTP